MDRHAVHAGEATGLSACAAVRLRYSALDRIVLVLRWMFLATGAAVVLWLGSAVLSSPAAQAATVPAAAQAVVLKAGNGSGKKNDGGQKKGNGKKAGKSGKKDKQADAKPAKNEKKAGNGAKGKKNPEKKKQQDKPGDKKAGGKKPDGQKAGDKKAGGAKGDQKKPGKAGEQRPGKKKDKAGSGKAKKDKKQGQKNRIRSTTGKTGKQAQQNRAEDAVRDIVNAEDGQSVREAVRDYVQDRLRDSVDGNVKDDVREMLRELAEIAKQHGLTDAEIAGIANAIEKALANTADGAGELGVGWRDRWFPEESRAPPQNVDHEDEAEDIDELLDLRIQLENSEDRLEKARERYTDGTITRAQLRDLLAEHRTLAQVVRAAQADVDAADSNLVDTVVTTNARLASVQERLENATGAERKRLAERYETLRDRVAAVTLRLMDAAGRAPETPQAGDLGGAGVDAGCGVDGAFVVCTAVSVTASGEERTNQCVALRGISSGCGASIRSGDSTATASCELTGSAKGCGSDARGGAVTASARCDGLSGCAQHSAVTTEGAIAACSIGTGACHSHSGGADSAAKTRIDAAGHAHCSVSGGHCDTESTTARGGSGLSLVSTAAAQVDCRTDDCVGSARTRTLGGPANERRGSAASATCLAVGADCGIGGQTQVARRHAGPEALPGAKGIVSTSTADASVTCDAGRQCTGAVRTTSAGWDRRYADGARDTAADSAFCTGITAGCMALSTSVGSSAPGATLALAADPATVNRDRLVRGPSAAAASGAVLTCDPDSPCTGTVGSSAEATDPKVSDDPRGTRSTGRCEDVDGGVCVAVTNSGSSSGPDANEIAPLVEEPSTTNATVTTESTGDQPPADEQVPQQPKAPGSSANSGGPTVPGASSWSMSSATLNCVGSTRCSGVVSTRASGTDTPRGEHRAGGARGPPRASPDTSAECVTGRSACVAYTSSEAGSGQVVADMVKEQARSSVDQLAEEAAQARKAAREAERRAARKGATAKDEKAAEKAAERAREATKAAREARDNATGPVKDAPALLAQSASYGECEGPGCRARTTGKVTGFAGKAPTVSRCTGGPTGCRVTSDASLAIFFNAGEEPKEKKAKKKDRCRKDRCEKDGRGKLREAGKGKKKDRTIPGISVTAQIGGSLVCPTGCTGKIIGRGTAEAGPDARGGHSRGRGVIRCTGKRLCKAQLTVTVTATWGWPRPEKQDTGKKDTRKKEKADPPPPFVTTGVSVTGTCKDGTADGCRVRIVSRSKANGAKDDSVRDRGVARCVRAGRCAVGTGAYATKGVAQVTADCRGEGCRVRTVGRAHEAGHRAVARASCTAGAKGGCRVMSQVAANAQSAQASASCHGGKGADCHRMFRSSSHATSHTGGNHAAARASCGDRGGEGRGWCATSAVADTRPGQAMAAASCQGSKGTGCRHSYRASSAAASTTGGNHASASARCGDHGGSGSGWCGVSAVAQTGPGHAMAAASCAGSKGSGCRYAYSAHSSASAPGASATATGSGGGRFGGGMVMTTASASSGPGFAAASASCTGSAGTNCSHHYSASVSAYDSHPSGSWASAHASGSGGGGMGGGGVMVSAFAVAGNGFAQAGASCTGAANCSASYSAHAAAHDRLVTPEGIYTADKWATCSGSGNGGCAAWAIAVAGPNGVAKAGCSGNGGCETGGAGLGFIKAKKPVAGNGVAVDENGKPIPIGKVGRKNAAAQVTRLPDGRVKIQIKPRGETSPQTKTCTAPCSLTTGGITAGSDGGKTPYYVSMPVEGEQGSTHEVRGQRGVGVAQDRKGNAEAWVKGIGRAVDGRSGNKVVFTRPAPADPGATVPNSWEDLYTQPLELGGTGRPRTNTVQFANKAGSPFASTCNGGCRWTSPTGESLRVWGSQGHIQAQDGNLSPAQIWFVGGGRFTNRQGDVVHVYRPRGPTDGSGLTTITGRGAYGTPGRYTIAGGNGYIQFKDPHYSRANNPNYAEGKDVYRVDVAGVALGPPPLAEVTTPDGSGLGGTISCNGICTVTRPGSFSDGSGGRPAYNPVTACPGNCRITEQLPTLTGPFPYGYGSVELLGGGGTVTRHTPWGDVQSCTAVGSCSFTQYNRSIAGPDGKGAGRGGGAICEAAGGSCYGVNAYGEIEYGASSEGSVRTGLLYRSTGRDRHAGSFCTGSGDACYAGDPWLGPDHRPILGKRAPEMAAPPETSAAMAAVLDPTVSVTPATARRLARLIVDTAAPGQEPKASKVLNRRPNDLRPLSAAELEALEGAAVTDPAAKALLRAYEVEMGPLTAAQRHGVSMAILEDESAIAHLQPEYRALEPKIDRLTRLTTRARRGDEYISDREWARIAPLRDQIEDKAPGLLVRWDAAQSRLQLMRAASWTIDDFTAANQAVGNDPQVIRHLTGAPFVNTGDSDLAVLLAGPLYADNAADARRLLGGDAQQMQAIRTVAGQQQALATAQLALQSAIGRRSLALGDRTARFNAVYHRVLERGGPTTAEAMWLLGERAAIAAAQDRIARAARPYLSDIDAAERVLRRTDLAYASASGNPEWAAALTAAYHRHNRVNTLHQVLSVSAQPRQQRLALTFGVLTGLTELRYNYVRDLRFEAPENYRPGDPIGPGQSLLGGRALPSTMLPDFRYVHTAALHYSDWSGYDGELATLIDDTMTRDQQALQAAFGVTPRQMEVERLPFEIENSERSIAELVGEDDAGKVHDRVGELSADGKVEAITMPYFQPATEESDEGWTTVTLFRVRQSDGSYRYIDKTGAHYSGIEDFRDNNEMLAEDGRLVSLTDLGVDGLDRNGLGADGFRPDECGCDLMTGEGRDVSGWDKAKGWVVGGAMVVGGVLLWAGGGIATLATLGAASPLGAAAAIAGTALIAGGIAYTSYDVTSNIISRHNHGQSNSWSNPAARANYLGAAGNLLMVGGMGVAFKAALSGAARATAAMGGAGARGTASAGAVREALWTGAHTASSTSWRGFLGLQQASMASRIAYGANAAAFGTFAWTAGETTVSYLRNRAGMTPAERSLALAGLVQTWSMMAVPFAIGAAGRAGALRGYRAPGLPRSTAPVGPAAVPPSAGRGGRPPGRIETTHETQRKTVSVVLPERLQSHDPTSPTRSTAAPDRPGVYETAGGVRFEVVRGDFPDPHNIGLNTFREHTYTGLSTGAFPQTKAPVPAHAGRVEALWIGARVGGQKVVTPMLATLNLFAPQLEAAAARTPAARPAIVEIVDNIQATDVLASPFRVPAKSVPTPPTGGRATPLTPAPREPADVIVTPIPVWDRRLDETENRNGTLSLPGLLSVAVGSTRMAQAGGFLTGAGAGAGALGLLTGSTPTMLTGAGAIAAGALAAVHKIWVAKQARGPPLRQIATRIGIGAVGGIAAAALGHAWPHLAGQPDLAGVKALLVPLVTAGLVYRYVLRRQYANQESGMLTRPQRDAWISATGAYAVTAGLGMVKAFDVATPGWWLVPLSGVVGFTAAYVQRKEVGRTRLIKALVTGGLSVGVTAAVGALLALPGPQSAVVATVAIAALVYALPTAAAEYVNAWVGRIMVPIARLQFLAAKKHAALAHDQKAADRQRAAGRRLLDYLSFSPVDRRLLLRKAADPALAGLAAIMITLPGTGTDSLGGLLTRFAAAAGGVWLVNKLVRDPDEMRNGYYGYRSSRDTRGPERPLRWLWWRGDRIHRRIGTYREALSAVTGGASRSPEQLADVLWERLTAEPDLPSDGWRDLPDTAEIAAARERERAALQKRQERTAAALRFVVPVLAADPAVLAAVAADLRAAGRYSDAAAIDFQRRLGQALWERFVADHGTPRTAADPIWETRLRAALEQRNNLRAEYKAGPWRLLLELIKQHHLDNGAPHHADLLRAKAELRGLNIEIESITRPRAWLLDAVAELAEQRGVGLAGDIEAEKDPAAAQRLRALSATVRLLGAAAHVTSESALSSARKATFRASPALKVAFLTPGGVREWMTRRVRLAVVPGQQRRLLHRLIWTADRATLDAAYHRAAELLAEIGAYPHQVDVTLREARAALRDPSDLPVDQLLKAVRTEITAAHKLLGLAPGPERDEALVAARHTLGHFDAIYERAWSASLYRTGRGWSLMEKARLAAKALRSAHPDLFTEGQRGPPWQEGIDFDRRRGAFYTARGGGNEIHVGPWTRRHQYRRLDSYLPGREIVSRKFTQLALVTEKTAFGYLHELVNHYGVGTIIADTPHNREQLAAELIGTGLAGRQILEVPVQDEDVPHAVLAEAKRLDIVIRDDDGKAYGLPESGPGSGDPAQPRAPPSSDPAEFLVHLANAHCHLCGYDHPRAPIMRQVLEQLQASGNHRVVVFHPIPQHGKGSAAAGGSFYYLVTDVLNAAIGRPSRILRMSGVFGDVRSVHEVRALPRHLRRQAVLGTTGARTDIPGALAYLRGFTVLNPDIAGMIGETTIEKEAVTHLLGDHATHALNPAWLDQIQRLLAAAETLRGRAGLPDVLRKVIDGDDPAGSLAVLLENVDPIRELVGPQRAAGLLPSRELARLDIHNPNLRELLAAAQEQGHLLTLHNDFGLAQVLADARFTAREPDGGYGSSLLALLRQYPGARVIWAHLGMGKFTAPTPAFLGLWRRIFDDPGLRHIAADISWTEVARHLTETPEMTDAFVDLVRAHPDRLLYGSDSVRPLTLAQYHRPAVELLPVFERIRAEVGEEAWQQLANANLERRLAAAQRDVRRWAYRELRSGAWDGVLATLTPQHRHRLDEWIAAYERDHPRAQPTTAPAGPGRWQDPADTATAQLRDLLRWTTATSPAVAHGRYLMTPGLLRASLASTRAERRRAGNLALGLVGRPWRASLLDPQKGETAQPSAGRGGRPPAADPRDPTRENKRTRRPGSPEAFGYSVEAFVAGHQARLAFGDQRVARRVFDAVAASRRDQAAADHAMRRSRHRHLVRSLMVTAIAGALIAAGAPVLLAAPAAAGYAAAAGRGALNLVRAGPALHLRIQFDRHIEGRTFDMATIDRMVAATRRYAILSGASPERMRRIDTLTARFREQARPIAAEWARTGPSDRLRHEAAAAFGRMLDKAGVYAGVQYPSHAALTADTGLLGRTLATAIAATYVVGLFVHLQHAQLALLAVDVLFLLQLAPAVITGWAGRDTMSARPALRRLGHLVAFPVLTLASAVLLVSGGWLLAFPAAVLTLASARLTWIGIAIELNLGRPEIRHGILANTALNAALFLYGALALLPLWPALLLGLAGGAALLSVIAVIDAWRARRSARGPS